MNKIVNSISEIGYARVAACVPQLHLGNIVANANEIINCIDEAVDKKVQLIVFPELALTGYTIGDLFNNFSIQKDVLKYIKEIAKATEDKKITAVFGAPIYTESALYNCAVVCNDGKVIGLTSKTVIPNNSEFYELRWFTPGYLIDNNNKPYCKELNAYISTNNVYTSDEFNFAIEICEDLWSLNPPSNNLAAAGADIILNLSASNELIGKAEYRRNLVRMQSSKTLSGYIYTSAGINESTSDLLFSGHVLIAEPDKIIVDNSNNKFSFNRQMYVTDIDIDLIRHKRQQSKSFTQNISGFKADYFEFKNDLVDDTNILRIYSEYPFIPDHLNNDEALKEILDIQTYALARRIKQLNNSRPVIGISGGSDSTLAFIVALRACEVLNLPSGHVLAVTMPGFGTSGRTYNNAVKLIKSSGAEFKEISIKDVCIQHLKDIDLPENTYNITYENAQARERTQILFDLANMHKGFVVGTGDLSELALGWCTYNGDHMSNYAVNSGIPKTLVLNIIKIYSETNNKIYNKDFYDALADVINTPISPELLPTSNGNIAQKSEDSVGNYILQDFFLYHFMNNGSTIKKMYYLAVKTFANKFDPEYIKNTLKIFIRRFKSMQFKRNCIPDGIKVGSIALSPRGDLRLPSDLDVDTFTECLNKLD